MNLEGLLTEHMRSAASLLKIPAQTTFTASQ